MAEQSERSLASVIDWVLIGSGLILGCALLAMAVDTVRLVMAEAHQAVDTSGDTSGDE